MTLLSHTRAAALASVLAGPVFAADAPRGMPAASFAPPFSWTGCYLGGHLGGGWAQKNITDPVQLVQDGFLGAGATVGVTTVGAAPSGIVIGGQIGCDYQFASTWVIGVEGAALGSTMNGSTSVPLQSSVPGTSEAIVIHRPLSLQTLSLLFAVAYVF